MDIAARLANPGPMAAQIRIPCMLMRGGTSKGLYFRAADLPQDTLRRDQALLAAMGGSDPRQIDGVGGAHPLTSKVAIVSPSAGDDADIDYLFAQVVVGEGRVDTAPTCGNILAGVGPFAIERGLARADEDETRLRIRLVNTGALCEATVRTPGGEVASDGEARISGVPGTAAPVMLSFLDIAGSSCGALLPTGRGVDEIDDVPATMIDNGMPTVVLEARHVGATGYETPAELNADDAVKRKIEAIRLQAGPMMRLGNVTDKVVPKMTMVAPPRAGGAICTRTFIPHVCHEAFGVLGAVSVATACVLPESAAAAVAQVVAGARKAISVEHPSGAFTVALETRDGPERPRGRARGSVAHGTGLDGRKRPGAGERLSPGCACAGRTYSHGYELDRDR